MKNKKQHHYPLESFQHDVDDDSTEPMPFACDSTGTQTFHSHQNVHQEYMAAVRAKWRQQFKG